MPTIITIYGPHSQITGDYDRALVKEITSYPVPGAFFSKAYKQGRWDGRKHLSNSRTGAFPTGLVNTVAAQIPGVQIIDKRNVPTPVGRDFSLHGVTFDYPYDYQLTTCQAMVEKKQGIVKIATNGGKSEVACAVAKHLGLQTLFVVPNQELMYQSQKRFIKRLNMSESEIGIVGDGVWSLGSFVTVAMLPTLEARMDSQECQALLKSTQVLFLDECHRCGSETWFTVSTLCPAFYRFGLSGTPLDRTDGADLRLIAATGEVIVNIDNKYLVDRGVSARAQIIFDKITKPILNKSSKYATAYKQGVSENTQLIEKVVLWTKAFRELNLGVLILCEEIIHGKTIDDALWTHEALGDTFIPHQFIHGTEDSETRQAALHQFASGDLPVLIASRILDEGVDVPTIDALILAGSRKSKIRTMQRLGRGLRGKKLIVVEFSNFCHKYLTEHSLERLQDYRSEDCFPLHHSSPDVDLVQRLWNSEGG